MTRDGVRDLIRRLHQQPDGLFRIHDTHPDLYARARRYFGSWADAVTAAGIDYQVILRRAMKRSAIARRGPARRSQVNPGAAGARTFTRPKRPIQFPATHPPR